MISAEGKQMGVMPPQEGLKLAGEQDLDLVEVSPDAHPPVCRIMDYGKYKYQQDKKAQEARKKRTHSTITVKEVKLRPNTEDHDLNIKLRNIKRFLSSRNKIKITLQFRGRQMAHIELGKKMMNRIIEEIKDQGVIEQEPKLEGRFMNMVVAPKT